MKTLKETIVKEEFNPSFKSHKDTYNSFIKWYDKSLRHMDKEELVDMLTFIIEEIKSDTLDFIK